MLGVSVNPTLFVNLLTSVLKTLYGLLMALTSLLTSVFALFLLVETFPLFAVLTLSFLKSTLLQNSFLAKFLALLNSHSSKLFFSIFLHLCSPLFQKISLILIFVNIPQKFPLYHFLSNFSSL